MRAIIKDLYTYAQTNTLPLLGSNALDFWVDYVENYSIYDRYFRDSFYKFYYWLSFDDTDTIDNIYTDFVGAVQAHIFVNKKRYSELYKVQALADDAYDIVNNYDLSESVTKTNTGTQTNAQGAQENSYTKGTATDTDTHKVSPFDSSDFNNESEDTFVKGLRTDTDNLGTRSDTRTDNLTETIITSKSGNIGVQTAAEIIGGHIDLWNRFNFYKMIFDEIAKEYLLISDDYEISTTTTSSGTDSILAAIAALSAKLDTVEDNLSDKIDLAEANIRGDIVEVSTDGY